MSGAVLANLPLQNGPWIFLIIIGLVVLCALCLVGYLRYREPMVYDANLYDLGQPYCPAHVDVRIIGSHTVHTRLYDQDAES